MVSLLGPGEVRVQTGDQESSYYVSGGLIEIQPTVVTVLSDTAMRAEELDEEALKKAQKRKRLFGDEVRHHRPDRGLCLRAALSWSLARSRVCPQARRQLGSARPAARPWRAADRPSARVAGAREQRNLLRVGAELTSPELLVLAAEAAVKNERFDLAAEARPIV